MKELKDIAVQYAAEKTNVFLSQLIEQSFVDGYRMGYKDREDEIPVDLLDNKTEYVDLGLPSGTLWAKDYEKTECGSEQSLTYGNACNLSIPTNEQWIELKENCIWQISKVFRNGSYRDVYECLGPNGNTIEFTKTGYHSAEEYHYSSFAFFWTKGEINNNRRIAACIKSINAMVVCCWESLFTGYSLPVRLVKQNSNG